MISKINFFNFAELLTPGLKKKFNFFLLLSFISMGLEILGISIIFNLLYIISNEFVPNSFLNKFLPLEMIEQNQLFIILMVSIVLIFLIKNLFLIFFEYKKFEFLLDLRNTLAKKLFNLYLSKSFIFHINNNSSVLVRNIIDVDLVIQMMRSIITLIIELIVFIGVLMFVLYIEFTGSIATLFTLGIFSLMFFRKLQNASKTLGSKRLIYDAKKFQHMHQGFSLIKEIKLLNKKEFFVKKFSNFYYKASRAMGLHTFVSSLPRYILEWLMVLGIFILSMVIFIKGKDLNQIVPILGVFAAATLRLMPSVSRIMKSLQDLNFSVPAVNTLKKDLKDKILEKNNLEKTEVYYNLTINNLAFKFNKDEKEILKNINLEIKHYDKIGIIGESGVGKTTFVNLLLGLYSPTSGEILVGKSNLEKIKTNWQKSIGYVSQEVYLSDDSIKNNIAFGVEENLIDDERVNQILEKTQLETLIKKLPKGVNSNVGELGEKLSGGEKQRIGIARALYNNPSFLILDEFTSALDAKTEENIIKQLNRLRENKTMVIVSHRIQALSGCNKIYKLSKDGFSRIK